MADLAVDEILPESLADPADPTVIAMVHALVRVIVP